MEFMYFTILALSIITLYSRSFFIDRRMKILDYVLSIICLSIMIVIVGVVDIFGYWQIGASGLIEDFLGWFFLVLLATVIVIFAKIYLYWFKTRNSRK